MASNKKINKGINTDTKRDIMAEINRGNTGTDEARDEWVRYLAKALVRDWQRSHMYRCLRFR